MSDLSKLKCERSRIRRSFTNICKKIDISLKKEITEQDVTELTSLIELLTIKNSEMEERNALIMTALESIEGVRESDLNDEQDKIDEILLSYFKYKALVDKVVNPPQEVDGRSVQGSVNSEGSSVNRSKCKYKLPILQLKKFGGDLKDWLPFWSQFSKFDEDSTMDDNDKLGYLTQCMIENSPAKELVDSYPATGNMYASVVRSLKERFGREDLLTEFYIRELLKLIIRNTECKEKLGVSMLYDRLQSHLRNLETLGVTSENCAPILMPLVSSCLSQEMLKIWERNCAPNVKRTNPEATSKDYLDNLLLFLQVEVEGEQKVELARTGFGLLQSGHGARTKPCVQKKEKGVSNIPTATDLLTTTKFSGTSSCIFCVGNHNPQDCKTAQDMTLEKRRERVASSKACFCCLQRNHTANRCRNRPKCIICKRGHFVLMCDKTPKVEKPIDSKHTHQNVSNRVTKDETLVAVANHCGVLMQTLVVSVRSKNGCTRTARLLIDSASHRSYILSSLAMEMGYKPCRQEAIQHSLFGGATTGIVNHNIFHLYLSKLDQTYHCNFEVLGQPVICGQISPVIDGPWIRELADHNVVLSDTGMATDIEILVGADVAAKLWTGRKIPLSCGLVAMETNLGWTLSGRIPDSSLKVKSSQIQENLATVVTSMLTNEAKITDLWTLDTLGIVDPSEKSSKMEIEAAVQQHFVDTVSVIENGRFEVHLPWIENHPELPNNYQLSMKRLHTTVRKLKAEGYYEAYQGLLNEWLEEEVIEEVPTDELNFPCHYLPHRHVIKPNSTNPVRPVFDASSRENRNPSLNMCLEKGPNLLEKIPSVLARFRSKKVGVVGDIRRAFLQIGVCEKDRNFLRFLWLDRDGVLKHFRHRRVVFGVSPSPFLLESCIKFHLNNVKTLCEEGKSNWPISFIELLANSYYVDNCLASLEDEDRAQAFIDVASKVMADRQFELRGWEISGENNSPSPSNVLGLLWYKEEDALSVNFDSLLSVNTEKITKKVMLSAAHRIFDPIGLFCAVALIPKLLIQQTWELGLTWEQEVDEDIKKKFLDWFEEVSQLAQVKIPRWVANSNTTDNNWSLHVFSDACQTSYAAAIFLRVETEGNVSVQLVAAKARVAPTTKSSKGMTIPRLELLAASIGARLYASVVKDYNLSDVTTIFWTDATTVLAWIQRSEPWDVFVMNRIREIRELTSGCEWRHVPGIQNPADLLSRGCSPKNFLDSKWWEGPQWLVSSDDMWPRSCLEFNEAEINLEKKKGVVSSMVTSAMTHNWYYQRFSHYKMIVRTIGWIYRYKNNAKVKKDQRIHQDLTAEEFIFAEYKVLSMVQEETLNGVFDSKLSTLLPFVDKHGLIRIMTKISYRADDNDFRHPIVLSTEHPVVERLVMDIHVENCHAGVQLLMSILRQRFWLLGGRRAIRNVINSCIRCKRYCAKRLESKPIPLPEPRVRNARIFEVSGVDLAGPLYLKTTNGSREKAYICLFTCAVYRAVHLELLSSQSTDSFLQGFRRFMSRRGRPSIMYSDQGSNFLGLNNALKNLDWNEISQYSSVRKIDWRFNPPASPWWGGWWERLIGVLKKLLRRVLGRASLNFEEMQTILCDCEAVINSRPITYLSNDPNDLAHLTPSMFLQDIEEIGAPDLDLIKASDLRKRYEYRQELTETLRNRFRNEYLGQLKLTSSKYTPRDILIGDIMLIGDDSTSRLDWPLGRVTDVIRGADGIIRVVKLKTSRGVLTRPIQRLYPLELNFQLVDQEDKVSDHLRSILHQKIADEIQDSQPNPNSDLPLKTRGGRLIHRPERLDL